MELRFQQARTARDIDLVLDALHKTFERRNTHPLPAELPEPPEAWAVKFAELAAECKLGLSFEEAFRLVSSYYSNLLCSS